MEQDDLGACPTCGKARVRRGATVMCSSGTPSHPSQTALPHVTRGSLFGDDWVAMTDHTRTNTGSWYER